MKYNNMKYLIAILLLCIMTTPLSAKKKVFYDSKSNIVGITGDYQLLKNADKFYSLGITPNCPKNMSPKDLCEYWNQMNFGKKVLDALLDYNGTSLSEEKLKDLALKNVLKADDERAAIGVIGKENILKEDYLPILENQYIFINECIKERPGLGDKARWSAYKVNINKDILEQVYNSWNDMEKYNQIKVTISYIASGEAKNDIYTIKSTDGQIQSTVQELKIKTLREIATEVPAFAIRGQVISRHPFQMNIGYVNGIDDRDKVVIYRTKEKNGELYSSRVSTTRACNVMDSIANLYTFAGGQASYKRGDIAIYQPSQNASWTISANYMDHSGNLNFTYDHRFKLSPAGISQYFIMMFGVGGYEKSEKRLYSTDNGALVYSPLIINLGFGYGIGYEFAHCLEIEPYVLAQWETMFFISKKASPNGPTKSQAGPRDTSYARGATSNSARFPLGARLNINIMYPIQLVVGAEYIFNIKIPVAKNTERRIHNNPEKFFFEPTGYKRDGLNLYAGLRFNF